MCICAYLSVYICVYVRVYICVYVCMYVCMYVYTYSVNDMGMFTEEAGERYVFVHVNVNIYSYIIYI
jgi:hypothetical protein